ncbi:MAG: hypothetical protein IJS90_00130 [Clostridia bacterium]|nr:hypothetical protein [Clostridia bacterium]
MKLDDIFCGLPYGFSSFDKIKDRLIDCRAKARLPENAKTVISVLFPTTSARNTTKTQTFRGMP